MEKKINFEIKMLRPYVPSAFSRLPRSLDDIEYFKATELRNFLLYYGAKINYKNHFILINYFWF